MRLWSLLALFSLTATLTCSSSDGAGEFDDQSNSTATDSTNGHTAPKCASNTRAYGYAKTDLGDLIFQNNDVSLIAGHAAGKDCVNEVSLEFNIKGGCELKVTANTAGGIWQLQDGTFTGSSECGVFWPEDANITYDLDVSTSRFGLRDVPDMVISNDEQCADTTDDTPMMLTGYLRFIAAGAGTDGQDREIQFDVNELSIKGRFSAIETKSAECPSEPRLCQGIECGRDYFGAECGGCKTEGLSCIGGACVEGGCNPSSTNKGLGDAIGNQTYTDMNGQPFELHSLCQAPAVYMLKVAHWCGACSIRAPSFKQLYDLYASKGAKFILLVGQVDPFTPAGPADALSYKQKLGYQDGWIVLADPDFTKTEAIIDKTSNGIPSIQILDRDLVLRYSTTSTLYSASDQTALIQLLTQEGLL